MYGEVNVANEVLFFLLIIFSYLGLAFLLRKFIRLRTRSGAGLREESELIESDQFRQDLTTKYRSRKSLAKGVASIYSGKSGLRLFERIYWTVLILIIVGSAISWIISNLTPDMTVERALSELPMEGRISACKAPLVTFQDEIAIRSNFDYEWERFNEINVDIQDVLFENTSDDLRAAEITRACQGLFLSDGEFASQIKNQRAEIELEKAKQERAEREAKEKIQPLLDQWDALAWGQGGGSIIDYYRAASQAEYLIKSGASYSLTGVNVNLQSVYCWPTTISRWSNGNPNGWWTCFLRPLGGSGEFYSIEFSGTDWSGKPGDRVGESLNWEIPDELEEWIKTQI